MASRPIFNAQNLFMALVSLWEAYNLPTTMFPCACLRTYSRILSSRIFNKILRNLYSLFDDCQGLVTDLWSRVVVQGCIHGTWAWESMFWLEFFVSLPQPWSRYWVYCFPTMIRVKVSRPICGVPNILMELHIHLFHPYA